MKKFFVISLLILSVFLTSLIFSCKKELPEIEVDTINLTIQGYQLTSDQVKELENELAENPEQIEKRIKLLSYYSRQIFSSESAGEAKRRHSLWIIENMPNAEIAGMPETRLSPADHAESYQKAKQLWLKQIKCYKKNPRVLKNAAQFFFINDKDLTEHILLNGKKLEPENYEWALTLAYHYQAEINYKTGKLRVMAALKALREFEEALRKAPDADRKYTILIYMPEVAFDTGDLKTARSYANELVKMAALHQPSSSEYADGTHKGNIILGEIELAQGNIEKAKEYLFKAGEVQGSPMLNSFGPDLTLALKLLHRGEKEVVSKFLNQCMDFWTTGRSDTLEWLLIIESGDIPDFGYNVRK